jgi:CspA family cold shock protein
MATGKVKWFNNAKGYGFILPEEGGEDLFAHYSSIEMEGYKTLKAGQDVEFEIQEGPKGYHAVNIRGEAVDDEESGPSETSENQTEATDANAEVSAEPAERAESQPTPETSSEVAS